MGVLEDLADRLSKEREQEQAAQAEPAGRAQGKPRPKAEPAWNPPLGSAVPITHRQILEEQAEKEGLWDKAKSMGVSAIGGLANFARGTGALVDVADELTGGNVGALTEDGSVFHGSAVDRALKGVSDWSQEHKSASAQLARMRQQEAVANENTQMGKFWAWLSNADADTIVSTLAENLPNLAGGVGIAKGALRILGQSGLRRSIVAGGLRRGLSREAAEKAADKAMNGIALGTGTETLVTGQVANQIMDDNVEDGRARREGVAWAPLVAAPSAAVDAGLGGWMRMTPEAAVLDRLVRKGTNGAARSSAKGGIRRAIGGEAVEQPVTGARALAGDIAAGGRAYAADVASEGLQGGTEQMGTNLAEGKPWYNELGESVAQEMEGSLGLSHIGAAGHVSERRAARNKQTDLLNPPPPPPDTRDFGDRITGSGPDKPTPPPQYEDTMEFGGSGTYSSPWKGKSYGGKTYEATGFAIPEAPDSWGNSGGTTYTQDTMPGYTTPPGRMETAEATRPYTQGYGASPYGGFGGGVNPYGNARVTTNAPTGIDRSDPNAEFAKVRRQESLAEQAKQQDLANEQARYTSELEANENESPDITSSRRRLAAERKETSSEASRIAEDRQQGNRRRTAARTEFENRRNKELSDLRTANSIERVKIGKEREKLRKQRETEAKAIEKERARIKQERDQANKGRSEAEKAIKLRKAEIARLDKEQKNAKTKKASGKLAKRRQRLASELEQLEKDFQSKFQADGDAMKALDAAEAELDRRQAAMERGEADIELDRREAELARKEAEAKKKFDAEEAELSRREKESAAKDAAELDRRTRANLEREAQREVDELALGRRTVEDKSRRVQRRVEIEAEHASREAGISSRTVPKLSAQAERLKGDIAARKIKAERGLKLNNTYGARTAQLDGELVNPKAGNVTIDYAGAQAKGSWKEQIEARKAALKKEKEEAEAKAKAEAAAKAEKKAKKDKKKGKAGKKEEAQPKQETPQTQEPPKQEEQKPQEPPKQETPPPPSGEAQETKPAASPTDVAKGLDNNTDTGEAIPTGEGKPQTPPTPPTPPSSAPAGETPPAGEKGGQSEAIPTGTTPPQPASKPKAEEKPKEQKPAAPKAEEKPQEVSLPPIPPAALVDPLDLVDEPHPESGKRAKLQDGTTVGVDVVKDTTGADIVVYAPINEKGELTGDAQVYNTASPEELEAVLAGEVGPFDGPVVNAGGQTQSTGVQEAIPTGETPPAGTPPAAQETSAPKGEAETPPPPPQGTEEKGQSEAIPTGTTPPAGPQPKGEPVDTWKVKLKANNRAAQVKVYETTTPGTYLVEYTTTAAKNVTSGKVLVKKDELEDYKSGKKGPFAPPVVNNPPPLTEEEKREKNRRKGLDTLGQDKDTGEAEQTTNEEREEMSSAVTTLREKLSDVRQILWSDTKNVMLQASNRDDAIVSKVVRKLSSVAAQITRGKVKSIPPEIQKALDILQASKNKAQGAAEALVHLINESADITDLQKNKFRSQLLLWNKRNSESDSKVKLSPATQRFIEVLTGASVDNTVSKFNKDMKSLDDSRGQDSASARRTTGDILKEYLFVEPWATGKPVTSFSDMKAVVDKFMQGVTALSHAVGDPSIVGITRNALHAKGLDTEAGFNALSEEDRANTKDLFVDAIREYTMTKEERAAYAAGTGTFVDLKLPVKGWSGADMMTTAATEKNFTKDILGINVAAAPQTDLVNDLVSAYEAVSWNGVDETGGDADTSGEAETPPAETPPAEEEVPPSEHVKTSTDMDNKAPSLVKIKGILDEKKRRKAEDAFRARENEFSREVRHKTGQDHHRVDPQSSWDIPIASLSPQIRDTLTAGLYKIVGLMETLGAQLDGSGQNVISMGAEEGRKGLGMLEYFDREFFIPHYDKDLGAHINSLDTQDAWTGYQVDTTREIVEGFIASYCNELPGWGKTLRKSIDKALDNKKKLGEQINGEYTHPNEREFAIWLRDQLPTDEGPGPNGGESAPAAAENTSAVAEEQVPDAMMDSVFKDKLGGNNESNVNPEAAGEVGGLEQGQPTAQGTAEGQGTAEQVQPAGTGERTGGDAQPGQPDNGGNRRQDGQPSESIDANDGTAPRADEGAGQKGNPKVRKSYGYGDYGYSEDAVDRVTSEIEDDPVLGAAFRTLVDNGDVIVVNSPEDIHEKGYDPRDYQDAAGIFFVDSGKAYLVADRIRDGDAASTLLHEVGMHMAADTSFKRVMKPVLERAHQLIRDATPDSDPIAWEARQRMESAGVDLNDKDECAAYLAEAAYANTLDSIHTPTAKWWSGVVGAVRSWLRKMGILGDQVSKLRSRDFAAIAQANVRAIADMKHGKRAVSTGSRVRAKRTDKGSDVKEVTRILENDPVLGEAFKSLRDAGAVEVVNSVFDIHEKGFDPAKEDPHTAGLHFGESGKSYIIAGHIHYSNIAMNTFLHEVGIHMADFNEFTKAMKPVLDRAVELVNNATPESDPIAYRARESLARAGALNDIHEYPAYLASEAYLADKENVNLPSAKWWNDIVNTLKEWLQKLGILKQNVNKLQSKDFAAIARANIYAIAQKKTGKPFPINPPPKQEKMSGSINENGETQAPPAEDPTKGKAPLDIDLNKAVDENTYARLDKAVSRRAVETVRKIFPAGKARQIALSVLDAFHWGKGQVLGLMFTEDIVNAIKDFIPSAKDWRDAHRAQELEATKWRSIGSEINQNYLSLPAAMQAKVEAFLADATLGGMWWFDKAELKGEYSWLSETDYDAANGSMDKEKTARLKEIQAAYNALDPVAQQVVRNVFKTSYKLGKTWEEERNKIYAAADQSTLDDLAEQIKELEADRAVATDPEEKARIGRKISNLKSQHTRLGNELVRKQSDLKTRTSMMSGPYAPLRREGSHLVVGRSAEYAKVEARVKELFAKVTQGGMSDNERAELRALTKQQREMRSSADHYVVMAVDGAATAQDLAIEQEKLSGGKLKFYSTSRLEDVFDATPEWQSMQKVVQAMTKKLESDNMSNDQRRLVGEMRAQAMQMMAKSIKQDAIQRTRLRREQVAGFDKHMMTSFMNNLSDQATALAGLMHYKDVTSAIGGMMSQARNAAPENRQVVSNMVNELLKRQNLDTTQKGNKFVEMVQKNNAFFMLFTSPSYYFQNATQPFMMTIPYMAGPFGYAKATSVFNQAYGEIARVVRRKRGASLADALRSIPGYDDDLIKAIVAASNKGLIDIGQAEDFGEGLQHEGAVGRAWDKARERMMLVNRRLEELNRISSFVAAYRLAKENPGAVKGIASEPEDFATEVVYRTHGDYGGFNSPRFFREGGLHAGGLEKLMFQFRKFQLIQVGMIGSMVNGMLTGATPEEQKAMKKALGYTVATHLAVCGLRGTPFAATTLWLLSSMLGAPGDDDEDYWRRIGGNGKLAEAVLNGVPSAFGFGTENISMANLLHPFPFMQDSGNKSDDFFLALGGPTVGLAHKVVQGYQYAANGDILKGAGYMLPKGAGNVAKAADLYVNGVTTKSGLTRIPPEDISLLTSVMQGFGFRVGDVAESSRAASSAWRHQQAMQAKMSQVNRAYREGNPSWSRMLVEYNKDAKTIGLPTKTVKDLRTAAKRANRQQAKMQAEEKARR